MDKLINAIHKGILKGINEHNINMLADIDDDITVNNIMVKNIIQNGAKLFLKKLPFQCLPLKSQVHILGHGIIAV